MGYVRTRFVQGVNGNTAVVNVGKATFNMVLLINLSKLFVARIFYAVFFVLAEYLYQQSVKVFRSCAYNYLIGIDQHSTERFQVVGDRRPQLIYSARGRNLHKLTASFGHCFTQELCPDRKRKVVGIYFVVRQVKPEFSRFFGNFYIQFNACPGRNP